MITDGPNNNIKDGTAAAEDSALNSDNIENTAKEDGALNLNPDNIPKTAKEDESFALTDDNATDSAADGTTEATLAPREARSESDAGNAYVPKNKYEAALLHVYRDKTLSEMLRITSLFTVLFSLYSYIFNIALLIGSAEYMAVIRIVLITAVPFVCVSIARKLIKAPRPYEELPFYEITPKKKKGCSFPSRHVFSIFVIATVLIPYNLLHSIILFAAGIGLAVCRVLLGIHYVRDTVAGALIGIISGFLGLFITGLLLTGIMH